MQHLYAPWRSKYFSEKKDECPFCAAARMVENLGENLSKNSAEISHENLLKNSSQISTQKLENSAEVSNSNLSKNSTQKLKISQKTLEKDREFGVIFRAEFCFGLMNLYPYSPGHFMILPYLHEENIENLPPETWTQMSRLVRDGVGILRTKIGARGVNIGMNLGAQAGAGLSPHCHYHLVPRWNGDTNFITTIAQTRVCGRDLGEIAEDLRMAFGGVL